MSVVEQAPARVARLDPEAFKEAFRAHPAGVALITASDGVARTALTASSLASVSADPPILMFSVAASSSSARVLRRSESLVVHLLTAADLELALLGAATGTDRFADENAWTELVGGELVFPAASRWLRARVLHRIDAGGSTVVVAEALEAGAAAGAPSDAPADGLVYRNRQWHRIDETTRIHP